MSDQAFSTINKKIMASHTLTWWSPANAVYCILLPYLGYIVFLCEVGCQNKASEPISVSRPTDSRLRSPAKLTWTASPVLVTQWCGAALYVSICCLNQRKACVCNTGM